MSASSTQHPRWYTECHELQVAVAATEVETVAEGAEVEAEDAAWPACAPTRLSQHSTCMHAVWHRCLGMSLACGSGQ